MEIQCCSQENGAQISSLKGKNEKSGRVSCKIASLYHGKSDKYMCPEHECISSPGHFVHQRPMCVTWEYDLFKELQCGFGINNHSISIFFLDSFTWISSWYPIFNIFQIKFIVFILKPTPFFFGRGFPNVSLFCPSGSDIQSHL